MIFTNNVPDYLTRRAQLAELEQLTCKSAGALIREWDKSTLDWLVWYQKQKRVAAMLGKCVKEQR